MDLAKMEEEEIRLVKVFRQMYTPGMKFQVSEDGKTLIVESGKLRALLRWLVIEGQSDLLSLQAFLRTFETYNATAVQLLGYVYRLLKKVCGANVEEEALKLERSVIHRTTWFLVTWMNTCPSDFDNVFRRDAIDATFTIIDLLTNKKYMEEANKLKLALIRCSHQRRKSIGNQKLTPMQMRKERGSSMTLGSTNSLHRSDSLEKSSGSSVKVGSTSTPDVSKRNSASASASDISLSKKRSHNEPSSPASPSSVSSSASSVSISSGPADELDRRSSKKMLSIDGKSFSEISSREFAEQLTRRDSQIYNSIIPSELIGLSWRKSPNKSKNVIQLINRSTQLSLWCATQVCVGGDIDTRVQMLKKLIGTIEKCVDLNNFNTVMAIMGGLGNSSVQRLKKTWEALPSHYASVWRKVSILMDPLKSYQAYRQTLSQVTGPCVPFLGVVLQDLTFVEDGNPDMIDKAINFHKVKLMGNIIGEVQKYQSSPYKLKRDKIIARFIRRSIFDQESDVTDDMLYKLSLQAEPSVGAAIEDISIDDIINQKLVEESRNATADE